MLSKPKQHTKLLWYFNIHSKGHTKVLNTGFDKLGPTKTALLTQ